MTTPLLLTTRSPMLSVIPSLFAFILLDPCLPYSISPSIVCIHIILPFLPTTITLKTTFFFLLTCFYFSFGSLLLSLSLRSANPRLSILFLSINPLSHPIISNLLKIKHTLLTCPYDIADMHATGVDTCHCCSCFLSSILHILS